MIDIDDAKLISDRNQMIDNGVGFLQSIAAVYGAERAHEVWCAMGPAMGNDVQLQVFSAMLMHPAGVGVVRFRHTPASRDWIVATIKAIRHATAMGLKEAKDLSDDANFQYASVKVANQQQAAWLRTELRQLGLEVA